MGLINTEHLQRFAKGFEDKARELFAKKTDIPSALPADGGDAKTVNGHTVNADVPEGAKFTDNNTTYSTMKGASASTEGTQGLVPAPAKGKQDAFLRGDSEWVEMTEATDADIDAIIAGTFKEEDLL